MQKTTVAAVLSLLVVVLAGAPAYATDCSAGDYQASGGFVWIDYSAEKLYEQKTTWDCWSLNGVSPTTLNFYNTPGFEMRALSGSATRSFTVPTGAGGHYEIEMFVELYSPDATWYDQINASVVVHHPANNSNTSYSLYYRNGAQGNDTGSTPYVDIYNVAEGDTITLYIQGAWSFNSDAHARFTNVHFFNLVNF